MTDHMHCPEGCDHPQPFTRDGVSYCGRCWFVDQELIEMIPCDKENCE